MMVFFFDDSKHFFIICFESLCFFFFTTFVTSVLNISEDVLASSKLDGTLLSPNNEGGCTPFGTTADIFTFLLLLNFGFILLTSLIVLEEISSNGGVVLVGVDFIFLPKHGVNLIDVEQGGVVTDFVNRDA